MRGGIMLATSLSTLVFAFQLCHAQMVSSQQCATGVHAVLARGQGAGSDLDVLVTIQDLILQQIPGSTSQALPYDHGGSDKFLAVHDGALMLQEYVRDYVASCGPEAKIALVGYSMGAVVMMEALCGTSSVGLDPVNAIEAAYAKNVITAAAYGDETYMPFMPWNTGNCTVGIGEFPRLDASSCDPFAASLHSYCDYGDDQCCFVYPLDNNAAHHTYVDKYNEDVVRFIQSRLGDS